MKLACILIVSIFILIFWSSIKTTPIRKVSARDVEKDYTATKLLNDGAGSSVNPQIQKHKETLNPKSKNTKNNTDNGGDKKATRSEYFKEYYQKNKERLLKHKQNYKKQNREKVNENQRNYYKRNKERIQKNKKMYNQNNRDKLKEYQRKYRQNKKNVQSADNEGTSFVNSQTGDFSNLVKLSIVCEEEGTLFNQEEEECNNGEDEQNQIEVEEPNKILEEDTIDSNKKIHPFDLNEMPEDEELEDY